MWIRAYTAKNEGKPSEAIFVRTDVRSPGEPVIVNLTCQNANTMFLKWLRPKAFYRTVDVYHVLYRQEEEPTWERQVVETVNNTVNHMVSACTANDRASKLFHNLAVRVRKWGRR